jgi:Cft2 family RNA processing exonuclease
VRICIHRGTQEIGGSCVELSAGGKRILLDLGKPREVRCSPESCLRASTVISSRCIR